MLIKGRNVKKNHRRGTSEPQEDIYTQSRCLRTFRSFTILRYYTGLEYEKARCYKSMILNIMRLSRSLNSCQSLNEKQPSMLFYDGTLWVQLKLWRHLLQKNGKSICCDNLRILLHVDTRYIDSLLSTNGLCATMWSYLTYSKVRRYRGTKANKIYCSYIRND